MQRRLLKKWLAGGVLLAALGMVAGCDDAKPVKPGDVDGSGLFENEDDVTVDVKEHSVVLDEAVDSLEVGSLGVFGGSRYFIALDDDPYDPEIDWDNELTEGSVISFAGSNEVRVVAMDDKYRVVAVWSISFPKELLKSSSSVADESSSSADEESSSSAEEETAESSSSSDVEDVSSSSEEETAESSSSEVAAESSSSEEIVESSSSEVSDPEFSADAESSSSDVEDVSSSSDAEGESSSSEEETAESSSSEVVVESSSSEEVVESSSSEEVFPESSSSEEPIEESSSSEEIIPSSSSVEPESSFSYLDEDEPQLPGSHFDSWDKNFWGSTSDAMATSKTVAWIKISASANAIFADSKLTLTTRRVGGSFIGIGADTKLASGFYFAGSYTGKTAVDIYDVDNTGSTPSTGASDFSKDMVFGQPFTARPVSFDVTYSYNHVDGGDSDYPQQGLIYVVLVSAENEIVAAGSIVKTETSEQTTETITLQYGSDAGLLDKNYAGLDGLTIGSGSEDVASIRVMFASSAYAYVAAYGSSNWRGGEGAQLILDNFKLNY